MLPLYPFCRIFATFCGVALSPLTRFGCPGSSSTPLSPGPTMRLSKGPIAWQAEHFWAKIAAPAFALPPAKFNWLVLGTVIWLLAVACSRCVRAYHAAYLAGGST